MSPNPKNNSPVTPQSGNGESTNPPNPNLEELIQDALSAMLAKLTFDPSGDNGDGNSRENDSDSSMKTRLHALPTELLVEIAKQLQPKDQIRIAYIYPELFLNANRVNIFVADAIEQLAIPTYLESTAESPRPLILHAISERLLSVAEIGCVLDIYEEVAIARGFDRHVFLNSAFPDNRPANVPDNGLTRDEYSPLHVAVEAGNRDLVKYLVERGADTHQAVASRVCMATGKVTPFQYALVVGCHFLRKEMDDIALDLAPYSPETTAFTTNSAQITMEHFEVSHELMHSFCGGLDRVALLLLERFWQLEGVDYTLPNVEHLLNATLLRVLDDSVPVPRAVRYMLEKRAPYFWVDFESLTEEAAFVGGSDINAIVTLRYELEESKDSLQATMTTMSRLASSDQNSFMFRQLFRVLLEANHQTGQFVSLHSTIAARDEAYQNRQFVLESMDPARFRGLDISLTIDHRDYATLKFITNSLAKAGTLADVVSKGKELNFALEMSNFVAAAHLLSVGVDPSRVTQANRDRVKTISDSIVAGGILDIIHFVFKNDSELQGVPNPGDEGEARRILDSIFSRLLLN
ncbi:hypothetical protein F4802DRAFT_594225 [Xylaria palmicola]|nr:hypothetical protein F4802DRAFT_594225 [Xylaria palmicola]